MRTFLRLLLFTCCIIPFLATPNAHAANSGIMLDPLRVELRNGKRSAKVTVINISKTEPVGFTIRTQILRMDKEGASSVPQKLTKREAISMAMFRHSPRTAVIPPGGQQVVRIALRKPQNLPDGEYYAYMDVKPFDVKKRQKATPKASQKTNDSSGLGLNINMLIGLRIPMVLRVGETSQKTSVVSIQKAQNKSGERGFFLTLTREGNQSSYTEVAIYANIHGEKQLIAHDRRLVTRLPLTSRTAFIPLTEKAFQHGTITVELTDVEDKDKKVYERKNFTL